MLRRHVKNLVAEVLYRTGLSPLLVRWRFRRRIVVLTYHRVMPASERASSFSHEAIMVEPATFDRHLAALSRHFICLRLEEFRAALRDGLHTARPRCLITFDDAWQDNYTHAFPILKKWCAPAVIFVPTDYIGTGKLFWQERLGHIVDQICTRHPEAAARLLAAHGWSELASLPQAERRQQITAAIRAIKHKNYAEIDRTITDLTAVLDNGEDGYGADSYLSTGQMREMMLCGISFQSHGCSHRVLPRLSTEELDRELRDSRRWLGNQLGGEPVALAYPNGDYTTAIQHATVRSGYALAFTTIPGSVREDSNPYALRRINMNDNAAGSAARLLMTLLLAGE